MASRTWRIEFYMPPPIDKWAALSGFEYVTKSFAMGGWFMLKSHYNQHRKHRLLDGDKVVDECGFQKLNN